jgi:hypothetical protein
MRAAQPPEAGTGLRAGEGRAGPGNDPGPAQPSLTGAPARHGDHRADGPCRQQAICSWPARCAVRPGDDGAGKRRPGVPGHDGPVTRQALALPGTSGIILAASRSGVPAAGHGGACGHITGLRPERGAGRQDGRPDLAAYSG